LISETFLVNNKNIKKNEAKFLRKDSRRYGNRKQCALKERWWKEYQHREQAREAKSCQFSRLYPKVTDSIWVGTMNQGRARIKVNGHWTPEVEAKYNELMGWYSEENIRTLYERYRDDSLIRWKESIAKVVGVKSDCATD